MNNDHEIREKYGAFYNKRTHLKVYPTEFVVRTMLAEYPKLEFRKPVKGDKVLDIAFGDGRNTVLLCDLDLDVSGVEIADDIVAQARGRLSKLGYSPDLRVGRNSALPFDDASFDYILACHCCYYCDEGESVHDNLAEYSRVLKPGGYLVASVADARSYIFHTAKLLQDGSFRIANDPYAARDGYRLYGFATEAEIESVFSRYFGDFSFGHADNDYYGRREQVFWLTCRKSE